MSFISPSSSDTLLDYSLSTIPDPLQVSPGAGNIVYGSLSFVVSNGSGEDVTVSKLQFQIPIGTNAQELTSDTGGISYAASPSGQWSIAMTSNGVFTAIPQSSVVVTTDGLVFQFYNIPINQQVGTVQIYVEETSSSASRDSMISTAVFNVAKFPYGFFFTNLTAQVPMVQEGQTVTLKWQGSDQATYTMYWGSRNEDVTNVRSWTSPALTGDTTFLLRAGVISQGEPLTLDLSTTVIVANPDLTASAIRVTGMSSLHNVNVGGTLRVDGTATLGTTSTGNLSASSFSVSGGTFMEGNIVASSIGVRNTGTFGALQVSGNGTFGSQEVTGAGTFGSLHVNGGATVNGVTNIMGGYQTLAIGNYFAVTDGIIVGTVLPSSAGTSGNTMTVATCTTTTGVSVRAQGGTIVTHASADGSKYKFNNGTNTNTFTLPIPKGTIFTLSVQNYSSNKVDSPVLFYWVPLGVGSPRPLTGVEAASLVPVKDFGDATEQIEYRPTDIHDLDIADLLEVLDDILGEHLDKSKREKLQNAIRRIVYFETKKVQ